MKNLCDAGPEGPRQIGSRIMGPIKWAQESWAPDSWALGSWAQRGDRGKGVLVKLIHVYAVARGGMFGQVPGNIL